MIKDFSSDRFFMQMVWLTMGLKVTLAWLVPLTGDEAYFVVWGNNLDFGYYDHPGMTGWWIWLTLLIGQHPPIVRLPAIVGPLLMALLMRSMLRPLDRTKANLAAVIFLLSPLNLLHVLMTTDTPIFILSLVSGWFVWRGERGGSNWNYLLGGLILGAAFFAKYFAVLLGLSFAVYLLLRRQPKVRELGLIFLGVIPWAALNIIWLYHNCWTNIVFNIYNRNKDFGLSAEGIGLLAVSILFLLGPAMVAFLLRPTGAVNRRTWVDFVARLRETKLDLFAICFALPLSIFLLVSLGQTVGMHWLLSFCAFLFPLLILLFETSGLVRLLKWTGLYSLALAGALIVLLLVPRDWASWHKSYSSVAIATTPLKILEQMHEAAPGALLATTSYTKSALLEFYAREHVMVVGPGSFHGRQDDMITDFRLLEGQDMVILASNSARGQRLEPCFAQYREISIEAGGATLPVFIGEGFRYEIYRQLVLRPVAEDYYTLPQWLKAFSSDCFFCEKYGLCQE